MNEIEKHPVLDYIVNILKNAIADSKVENYSAGEFTIKDGNDVIHLKQQGNSNILITDNRHIIFSEDLLETLQHLHKGVKGNDELKKALQAATIIINGLDIETELVFQAVKDFLDQVSNSYEFSKAIENKVNQLKAQFKFGKHVFVIQINNNKDQILVNPTFDTSFDATIQKTIIEDITKVQVAVNKMFGRD